SKHTFLYNDNDVPSDYKYTEDDELGEIDTTKEQKAKYKDVMKLRKQQGKFVIGQCMDRSTSYTNRYVYSSKEVNTSDFKDNEEIVYGFTEDNEILTVLARLHSNKNGVTTTPKGSLLGWTNDFKVCRISNTNKKYLAD